MSSIISLKINREDNPLTPPPSRVRIRGAWSIRSTTLGVSNTNMKKNLDYTSYKRAITCRAKPLQKPLVPLCEVVAFWGHYDVGDRIPRLQRLIAKVVPWPKVYFIYLTNPRHVPRLPFRQPSESRNFTLIQIAFFWWYQDICYSLGQSQLFDTKEHGSVKFWRCSASSVSDTCGYRILISDTQCSRLTVTLVTKGLVWDERPGLKPGCSVTRHLGNCNGVTW